MLILGMKEFWYQPHQFAMLTVVRSRASKMIATATSAIQVSTNACKGVMAKTKGPLYPVKLGNYARRFVPMGNACSPVMEAKSVRRNVMAANALQPATTITTSANNNVSLETAQ